MRQFQRAIQRYIHTPRLTKLSLQPPKSVEVKYADGSMYNLSAEFLRIYSPAADSKIRSVGGEKVIYGRRHVGIMSGEPVGNYGVRLLFDDLHKTGIYTWDYLYHIGSNKFTLMRNYIKTLKKHGLSRDPPRRKKMGDAACVMHPFTYISGTSDETHQMNPLHALGESVSFGRFMTDSSLSWEKWSTFTQNRHVEEAERYAQPGSVAEKKAFFEAHYKRIAAAKKAAALLEQENAAKNAAEPEFGSGGCIDTNPETEKSSLESQEQILIKTESGKENFMVSAVEDDSNSNANYAIPDELGLGKVGLMEMDTETKVLGEIAMNIGSIDPPENFEDKNMVSRLENPLLKGAVQMERKKRPFLSTMKSSVFRKVASTPAKAMPPLHPRKENSYTPTTIRSTMEPIDKKRSTPKSLRRFINFTPTKRPEKLSTPAARKIESSDADTNFYKAKKDFATPLKTPASVIGMPKHTLVTPFIESKRDKELLDPLASGSKTTGPKWHLLSSVCSKSLSACRKKLQSSTLSTPFTLRTEERAARRKQKLEDRFNEKEAQNVQRQAKLKEKAETEVGKFGPSLCFRARPLPDFYRERETSKKQTKKAQEMHPQPPKQVGKNAGSSSIHGTNPFAKSSTNSLKNFLKKNTQA